jgi:hypothetical protein
MLDPVLILSIKIFENKFAVPLYRYKQTSEHFIEKWRFLIFNQASGAFLRPVANSTKRIRLFGEFESKRVLFWNV